jgi:hypothetical protein
VAIITQETKDQKNGGALVVGHQLGDRGDDRSSVECWRVDSKGAVQEAMVLVEESEPRVVSVKRAVGSSDASQVWIVGQSRAIASITDTAETWMLKLKLSPKDPENGNGETSSSVLRLPSVCSDYMSYGSAVAVDAKSNLVYAVGSMQTSKVAWHRSGFLSVTPN